MVTLAPSCVRHLESLWPPALHSPNRSRFWPCRAQNVSWRHGPLSAALRLQSEEAILNPWSSCFSGCRDLSVPALAGDLDPQRAEQLQQASHSMPWLWGDSPCRNARPMFLGHADWLEPKWKKDHLRAENRPAIPCIIVGCLPLLSCNTTHHSSSFIIIIIIIILYGIAMYHRVIKCRYIMIHPDTRSATTKGISKIFLNAEQPDRLRVCDPQSLLIARGRGWVEAMFRPGGKGGVNYG